MRLIDRKFFFEGYRKRFGRLNQSQVDAIEQLLRFLEADDEVMDARWAAYMLATVKHETADTFLPIEEYGKGKGRTYGAPVSGKVYYGRGYVQLTWFKNYKHLGEVLGIPLAEQPELALDPKIAYKIMSLGMRRGLFTGKRLGQYLNDGTCNYIMARKIINSQDQAKKIAGYAEIFEVLLNGG